jgi:septal ring factor EnvC (AmiA/AmiB activator)
LSHVSQKTNFETTTKHTTMSTANRSKPLETAAIIIGVLAIAASAYFIFMTEGSAYRLTNWIISLAFLVFVAYNFINVRSLKGEVGALSDRNAEVTQELQGTKQSLVEAQADLQTVKSDLISAEEEAAVREKEVERLRNKLESDEG